MKNKSLILPEIIKGLKWWWSYWVSKKLYLFDKKNIFDYIMSDEKIIYKNISNKKNIFINIRKILKGLELSLYFIKEIINNSNYLSKYDFKYNSIVSNNIIQTYSLIKKINNQNIIYIHHLNWNLYNQTKSFHNIEKSFLLKKICNYIENKVFSKSKIIWFPSKWAYEQYPNKGLLKWKRVEIFYNWIDVQEINNIKKNNLKNKIEFISVNTAIEWTWLDRIPLFLKQLKDNNIEFHWTFIWTWILTKKIISEIKKYKLEKYSTLILEKIEHQLVLEKMKKSNFYLWFHRISVFDFSILEAMSQWCIPILTKVWWNKDFIEENNWLLIKENKIYDCWKLFIEYFNTINYWNISNNNISIVKNKFNTKKFFEKYKKIANEL